MPTWRQITLTSQQRIMLLFFFVERSYPRVWNWTTAEISGNINPDNSGILGASCHLENTHTNLPAPVFFVACQGRTSAAGKDGWSMRGWSWGSADPSPSFSSFPRAPSISTPPPSPPRPFLPSSCLPRPVESDLLLLLHQASISQAQCTPRSRKPSPPPPPPKCQWSMESSLCWGKEWITDAHHCIQTIQLGMEPYFPSFLFTMMLK